MNPNKIISPGELSVGQSVTIYEWLPRDVPPDPFSGLFGGATTATKHRDRSWCGDVLKVEAVDLPYVVVSHPNQSYYDSNTKLDTREVKLMELSAEYVKAMSNKRTAR